MCPFALLALAGIFALAGLSTYRAIRRGFEPG
jgi:hypothetical protein